MIVYKLSKIVHNRVETEVNNVFALKQKPITSTSGLLTLSIG